MRACSVSSRMRESAGERSSFEGTLTNDDDTLAHLDSLMKGPCVNACVILRPNNFDPPPVIFFPKLTRSKILTPSFSHTAVRCGSPTLRQVVSTWTCCGGRLAPRRAHEGYTAEPLRALVSEASPTTAIQVVRPAAPTASTRSLRMPTEQGHSALDSHKPTLAHGSSAAPG